MSKKIEKTLIGTTDFIDLPQLDLTDIACKIDTGAATSSINCSEVRIVEKDGTEFLCLKFYAPRFGIHARKEFRFKDFSQRKVRSSNGAQEIRYTIKTPVNIFNRSLSTEFTLSFRDKMKFPILLGKRFLKNKFVVDVAQKNINKNFKETI